MRLLDYYEGSLVALVEAPGRAESEAAAAGVARAVGSALAAGSLSLGPEFPLLGAGLLAGPGPAASLPLATPFPRAAPPAPAPAPGAASGLSAGAIAGIVIGAITAAILLLLALAFAYRRVTHVGFGGGSLDGTGPPSVGAAPPLPWGGGGPPLGTPRPGWGPATGAALPTPRPAFGLGPLAAPLPLYGSRPPSRRGSPSPTRRAPSRSPSPPRRAPSPPPPGYFAAAPMRTAGLCDLVVYVRLPRMGFDVRSSPSGASAVRVPLSVVVYDSEGLMERTAAGYKLSSEEVAFEGLLPGEKRVTLETKAGAPLAAARARVAPGSVGVARLDVEALPVLVTVRTSVLAMLEEGAVEPCALALAYTAYARPPAPTAPPPPLPPPSSACAASARRPAFQAPPDLAGRQGDAAAETDTFGDALFVLPPSAFGPRLPAYLEVRSARDGRLLASKELPALRPFSRLVVPLGEFSARGSGGAAAAPAPGPAVRFQEQPTEAAPASGLAPGGGTDALAPRPASPAASPAAPVEAAGGAGEGPGAGRDPLGAALALARHLSDDIRRDLDASLADASAHLDRLEGGAPPRRSRRPRAPDTSEEEEELEEEEERPRRRRSSSPAGAAGPAGRCRPLQRLRGGGGEGEGEPSPASVRWAPRGSDPEDEEEEEAARRRTARRGVRAPELRGGGRAASTAEPQQQSPLPAPHSRGLSVSPLKGAGPGAAAGAGGAFRGPPLQPSRGPSAHPPPRHAAPRAAGPRAGAYPRRARRPPARPSASTAAPSAGAATPVASPAGASPSRYPPISTSRGPSPEKSQRPPRAGPRTPAAAGTPSLGADSPSRHSRYQTPLPGGDRD
eukprot:tig00020938_g16146.t1